MNNGTCVDRCRCCNERSRRGGRGIVRMRGIARERQGKGGIKIVVVAVVAVVVIKQGRTG